MIMNYIIKYLNILVVEKEVLNNLKEFFTINAILYGNNSLMYWPTFIDYD